MVLEVLAVWVFEDQNEMEAVVQVAPTVTVKQIETLLTCRHIVVVPSRILSDCGLRFTER
jgi:hypothetical protein